MANPSTYPSDGRITSLALFTGSLSGNELFLIVSPPAPALAVNYQLSATTLAALIVNSFPQQSPNTIFSGPALGTATGTPTFRAMVLGDLPTGTASLPLVANGAGTASSYQALNLAGAGVTGVLGVPNGGIGTAALPLDGLVVGNGTGALSVVPATTAGLLLTSNGSTSPPTYQAFSLGTTVIGVPNGGTGTTALTLDGLLLGNGTNAVGVVAATTAGYGLISNGSTSSPTYQAQGLQSTFVTGILGVPNGGIGTGALSAGGVALGNGTSPFSVVAATTAGLVLTSQGSTVPPIFSAPVSGSTAPFNASTLTTAGILYGAGTATVQVTAAGTTGYVFTGNGSTAAPSFTTFVPNLSVTTLTASGLTIQTTVIHQGSIIVAFRSVASGTAATLSSSTDYFLGINVATAFTVNLPGSPATGLTFLIKDIGGSASTTNTITIKPAAGSVDNASTFVMNYAYGSIGITYNGTAWSLN